MSTPKSKPRLRLPKPDKTSYLATLPPELQNLLSDIAYSCSSKYMVKIRNTSIKLWIISRMDDVMNISFQFDPKYMSTKYNRDNYAVNLGEFIEQIILGEESKTYIGNDILITRGKSNSIYLFAGSSPVTIELKLCQQLLDSLLEIWEHYRNTMIK